MNDKQKIKEMEKEPIKNSVKTDNSKETLQAIFDNVRDGLVILDKTGKIIQISDSLIRMGGYSRKEIISKRLGLMTMFSPKSLSQMLIHFIGTLAGNEAMPYEIEGMTKSGKKLFAEVSGNSLRLKGKIVGVVAILRDITERKKIEDELKEKNEMLEKFNKFAVGRELKIIELKKKVKELEKRGMK
ncbi:MAG: PAS domain S-box protein [Candidatus Pacebacteria bacterium]|nr:PAS domain S-box protein [Candidatus Paceibacterota bacterium]